MSSLTLITGSITDVRDPQGRFNPEEVSYTFLEEHPTNQNLLIERHEPLPLYFLSPVRGLFEIVQDLGSGKTLLGVNLLARKQFGGGACYANLGLAWQAENVGKDKKDWVATINSLEDLQAFNNCTILIDDISGTILHWATDTARFVQTVANERRKMKKDLIVTAQRENMIPPGLRDMATEWIVPVITLRDFTQETPDNTGYPLELRAIHFNGAKIFKFVGDPIIGLEKLFAAYNTVEKAIGLQHGGGKARSNQSGFALEAEAFEYLKQIQPSKNWVHLNGKDEFDIDCDTHAIDVCGWDRKYLILEHKDLLSHIRVAKRLGQMPLLMYKYDNQWKFKLITYKLNEKVRRKYIDGDFLQPTQQKDVWR